MDKQWVWIPDDLLHITEQEAREEARQATMANGKPHHVCLVVATYTKPEPAVVETNLVRRHKAKTLVEAPKPTPRGKKIDPVPDHICGPCLDKIIPSRLPADWLPCGTGKCRSCHEPARELWRKA